MRRVGSAGSLTEDPSRLHSSPISVPPPLSLQRKHASLPNLAAMDTGSSCGSTSKPPRPGSGAGGPLSRKSANASSKVATKALPPLFMDATPALSGFGRFMAAEVQLESHLHVPVGHAHACLADARRSHSSTLPSPSPKWQDTSDSSPSVLSAEWVLSGHSEGLSKEEISSTAACLAAPPTEAIEETEAEQAEIEEERIAVQRAMTTSRAASADAARLSTAQEASSISDRFSQLVRRRRRNEQRQAALRRLGLDPSSPNNKHSDPQPPKPPQGKVADAVDSPRSECAGSPRSPFTMRTLQKALVHPTRHVLAHLGM